MSERQSGPQWGPIPNGAPAGPPRSKRKAWLIVGGSIVGVFVVLAVIGSLLGDPNVEETADTTPSTVSTTTAVATTVESSMTTLEASTTAAPGVVTTAEAASVAAPAPSVAPPPSTGTTVTVKPAPTAAAPTKAAPAPVVPRTTVVPAPAPPPVADAPSPVVPGLNFKSCAAARAAGYSNMRIGTPGYSISLDRDRDGIACDK